MFVKSTENFLEAFEKRFSSKHEVLSEYSNLILSFTFSKSQLFSLFLTYILIGVSCCHDFLLMQRSRLGGSFKYLYHVRKENFKEPFFKKFQLKNELLPEYSTIVVRLVSSSCFELKLFFQRFLEHFLWILRRCSMYLKCPPNLDLCISKKIVTTRHTDQNICQEKPKKLRFEEK